MPFLIPLFQIFRPREPTPSWPGRLSPLPWRAFTHKFQAVKWLHRICSIQHGHTCKYHSWCERRGPSWVLLIFRVKSPCLSQQSTTNTPIPYWCQPDRFCWAACQCNTSKIQAGNSLPLGSGQTLNRQLQLYLLVATAFIPLYHPQSNLETVWPGRAANEYALIS